MEKQINIIIDEEEEKVTDAFFPLNFSIYIIGKPGSGKTTIIKSLLLSDNAFFQKFNFIILCSPSSEEYSHLIEGERLFTSLNLDMITLNINKINRMKIEKRNTLIILDDCIADIKEKHKDRRLEKLFFNRRHIMDNGIISLIITSQKYTMLPAKYRSNINFLIGFQINPSDCKKICEELIVTIEKSRFNTLLKHVCQEEHKFFIIDINHQLLYLNFNTF